MKCFSQSHTCIFLIGFGCEVCRPALWMACGESDWWPCSSCAGCSDLCSNLFYVCYCSWAVVRGKPAAFELWHGCTAGFLGSGSCWQLALCVTTSALDAMAFADRCCQVDPKVVSAWATHVYNRLPTDMLDKETFVLGPLEQVREGAIDVLKVVPYYASGGRKAACAVADCLTSIRHHALARHYQQLPVKWIQSGVPRVPLDASLGGQRRRSAC